MQRPGHSRAEQPALNCEHFASSRYARSACVQVAGANGTPDAVCLLKLAHTVRLHVLGFVVLSESISEPFVTTG